MTSRSCMSAQRPSQRCGRGRRASAPLAGSCRCPSSRHWRVLLITPSPRCCTAGTGGRGDGDREGLLKIAQHGERGMRKVLGLVLAASLLLPVSARAASLWDLYATLQTYKWVDLTHPFDTDIPHWKGFDP